MFGRYCAVEYSSDNAYKVQTEVDLEFESFEPDNMILYV